MTTQIRPAVIMFLLLTLLTGVAYPAAVTLIAQWTFPEQANGSLVRQDGAVVGSSLIGQPFSEARYFWGRPSATSPFPYNSGASSGSNLGPTNPALREAISARIAALRASEPGDDRPVPIELVTASASGLDPHISPAAAEFQISRVAKARAMSEDAVRALVAQFGEGRTLGILGEPRVNVLKLNRALDAQTPPVAGNSP